ncbi:hypothetical protein PMZ80_011080 [Knufia obscura]|uniref:ABC multidrug transporter MDR2 n=1 Tax=Knufia obscura TaxID=1635080 RepID=A0ABR0R937_9EURO|nr:hypothetical protein PMZ80_011080 [Knufia obscura]
MSPPSSSKTLAPYLELDFLHLQRPSFTPTTTGLAPPAIDITSQDENRHDVGQLVLHPTDPGPSFRRLTGYVRLLTYAEPSLQDVGLLVIGIIAAIAGGVPIPVLGIIFGQLMDDLNSASCDNATSSSSKVQSDVNSKVLIVVYIGIAKLVLIYVYIVCWSLFGYRLAQRIRERYIQSLLHKDISFFDKLSPGEVSSHLNADIDTIQQGSSEKVGIVLNAVSFFIAAYTIAFIKDPALGGMLVSLTPAFLLMSLVGGHFIGKYSGAMSSKTSSASSIALESLSNIIIVHAFGANSRLEERFSELLRGARSAGIKKAVTASIQSGLLYFIAYSSNALAYWQGSRQIADAVAGDGGTTVGTIYTVIFILVEATIFLSNVAPFLQIFGAAQSAFIKLEKNIQQKSELLNTGEQEAFDNFSPSIELKNVSFAYPSRPDTQVLRGVSLVFPANKHSAIIGLSGSGKSTIASLIMRLYDPSEGEVSLGGNNMRSLKLDHLRSCMSLVQQEPSLFDRSILENIALGLVSSRKHRHLQPLLHTGTLNEIAASVRNGENLVEAAKDYGKHAVEIIELVRQAAVLADADTFVSKLRHGYGTIVGSKGTLISGGQKQRISIARALVKDPDILVLDEATASLDSSSERRIQAALNKASKGRTTITIAHRLSTIRDADNVVVMKAGEVIEQGTHTELISKNAAYAELLRLQKHEDTSASNTQYDDAASISSVSTNTSQKDQDPTSSGDMANAKAAEPGQQVTPPQNQATSKDPDIDTKQSSSFMLRTLGPLFRPNLLVLLVAFVAVIIVGSTFSVAAVIFGNTVGALSPCRSVPSIRNAGEFFALMFFILAIVEFFANIVSWSGLGAVAERILHRVRILSFRSLMEQDLHWHESANRSPTSLLGVLTADVNALGGLTGSTIGTILSILVNLVVAIVLTHVLAWKIALVCLATVPLILGAGTMQLVVLSRFAARHREAFTKSVGIAVEAVESIKAISTLSLEDEVLRTYQRSLKAPIKETTQQALYAKGWLAIAFGIPTFIYALAYWWGTKLVIAGEYSQVQFFIVLIALLVSAQLWGQLFTIAPDVSKAFAAVRRVVNVINLGSGSTPPTTDVEKSATIIEKPSQPSGSGASVKFNNVAFSYPARPTFQVLDNLSLSIAPGQFAALVGQSGAGKSTIIALLERMYRPDSGTISIDNVDVASTPSTFRNQIAFVPQDSVLFEGSIRFNVSLGAATTQTVSDAEIEEACRVANIHDTITSLPNGYDTEVGTGGTQFSGGQKQRLAIARALVRKPRLLLLDESTSALDAESEKSFKDGLEEARRRTGMTVIAIAHRLGTIRNADVIFYLENGQVVEKGRHEDLMARCDAYRTNAKYQGF